MLLYLNVSSKTFDNLLLLLTMLILNLLQNLLNISLGKGEKVTLILSTGVSYGRWADDYNQQRIRLLLFFLNNYFTVKIFKADFQSQLTGMRWEDVKSEFIRDQIDNTKSILIENSDSQAHREILEYLLQERKKLNE